MFMCTGRVHGRVHGPSCTWQVGLPGYVHVPRRHATAVCGPSRPCTRPVHSPFTAMYTAVYDGRRHVHTSTPQLKGHVPCTRHVHGPVGRPTCRIHGPDDPCTRPCNGQVHGPLHGRVRRPCTRYVDGQKRQCTRPVYTAENGREHDPYTAVYTRR